MNDGQFPEARLTLERASATAESLGSHNWTARFESSLGLSWQLEVTSDLPTPVRDSLLARAREHYLLALRSDPEWGPALNNLGQIDCDQGRFDEGRNALQRAIRLHNDRWSLYMLNYAHCSLSAGDWKRARYYLLQVSDSLPGDVQVQRTTWAIYLQRDREGATEYLWRLVARGRSRQVVALALELLRQPEKTSAQLQEETATVLALALAQEEFDPSGETAGAAVESLLTIVQHPELGSMAAELVRLYERNTFTPKDYPWWISRDHRWQIGDLQESPREAIRELADALGQLHESVGLAAPAEHYYRLAVDLAPEVPFPKAVRHLVDLLVRQRRGAELQQLITQQAPIVDTGKNAAYGADDWKNVYLMHRAMGEISAAAESSGAKDTTLTPGYHLAKAQLAADRFNRSSRSVRKSDTLVVDTALVRIVAQKKLATNPHAAVEIRKGAAQQYIGQKRYIEAQEVLRIPPGASAKDSADIIQLRTKARPKN